MSTQIGEPLVREMGLADRVAEHVTERVLDGTLSRGTRMPPERVLAQQYGVSRTVIREAVRSLVSKGLLETRGGSGTYVRGPNPAAAAQSVTLLMRLHHDHAPVRYEKVHEVRRVLEVEIAALAAVRAEPDDLVALEREIAQLRHAREDRDSFVASDLGFHTALAVATHNELFPVLLNSISDTMAEVRRLGFATSDGYEQALLHHECLLEAIHARDPAAAVRAMEDHLRDSERILIEGLRIEATRAQRTSSEPASRAL